MLYFPEYKDSHCLRLSLSVFFITQGNSCWDCDKCNRPQSDTQFIRNSESSVLLWSKHNRANQLMFSGIQRQSLLNTRLSLSVFFDNRTIVVETAINATGPGALMLKRTHFWDVSLSVSVGLRLEVSPWEFVVQGARGNVNHRMQHAKEMVLRRSN